MNEVVRAVRGQGIDRQLRPAILFDENHLNIAYLEEPAENCEEIGGPYFLVRPIGYDVRELHFLPDHVLSEKRVFSAGSRAMASSTILLHCRAGCEHMMMRLKGAAGQVSRCGQ